MNIRKHSFVRTAVLLPMIVVSNMAVSGGNLDQYSAVGPADSLGRVPHKPVGIFWDKRCMPTFTIDSNSLPNAGPPNRIKRGQLVRAFRKAGKTWTDVPTSYIEMSFRSAPIRNADIKFDFVNTITFEQDLTDSLANAPTVKLIEDVTVTAGEDFDGDGDSDFFDPQLLGRNTCFDADGDGDIEFPAGSYAAGTILDADISFDASQLWTLDLGDISDGAGAWDIISIAQHELGHSLGLAHSMIMSFSDTDETNSTMWPFQVDDNREFAKALRSLSTDDIAWISYLYPEGSQNSGIAALQSGDRKFEDDFALIKGKVTVGNSAHLGSHIIVTSDNQQNPDNNQVLTAGYVGAAPIFQNSSNNQFERYPDSERSSVFTPDTLKYEIPVPRELNNQNIEDYTLKIEGIDGWPVRPSRISSHARWASEYSSQEILETFYSGKRMDRRERRGADVVDQPAEVVIPLSANSTTANFNFAVAERLTPSSRPAYRNIADVVRISDPPGTVFARRFPRAEFLQKINDGRKLVATRALTIVPIVDGAFDETTRPRFGRATLAVGKLDSGSNYTVRTVRQLTDEFVADDREFSPIHISPAVGDELANELIQDSDLDVFFVVEYKGENATSTQTQGLLNAFGNSENESYFSTTDIEGEFTATSLNLQMELEFLVPQ